MSRARIAGVEIDRLTPRDAVDRIVALARTRGRHIVVTPNLDHMIRLRSDNGFRGAYAAASLVLTDGMPLVWVSRIGKTPLPGRVSGADLVHPVLAESERKGCSVFFLGPMAATLELALKRCALEFPRLRVAGAHAPPLNFEHDPTLDAACVGAIRDAQPDIVFLALGTPKQELWIARHRSQLDYGVALCVGAGIDFFAGVQQRCPKLLAQIGAEWIWRLLREPKRLGRRYAQCLMFMPELVWEQIRDARRSKANS
jgi:N-acetylglucosaminyldiphosphoundecaprenol N-acetyl-beta-D-mannosaminyltransferase